MTQQFRSWRRSSEWSSSMRRKASGVAMSAAGFSKSCRDLGSTPTLVFLRARDDDATSATHFSGGIHHAFNQTSALLSPLGEQHGLATSIVVHPDAAFEALEEASVQLFVVNALFWEMEGANMMSSERIGSFACRSSKQRVWIVSLPEGKLLGLHTASICFSDLPAWSRYLGGHWRWPESFHPPIEALSVNPTPAGEALGLRRLRSRTSSIARFIEIQISAANDREERRRRRRSGGLAKRNMARPEAPTLR